MCVCVMCLSDVLVLVLGVVEYLCSLFDCVCVCVYVCASRMCVSCVCVCMCACLSARVCAVRRSVEPEDNEKLGLELGCFLLGAIERAVQLSIGFGRKVFRRGVVIRRLVRGR